MGRQKKVDSSYRVIEGPILRLIFVIPLLQPTAHSLSVGPHFLENMPSAVPVCNAREE